MVLALLLICDNNGFSETHQLWRKIDGSTMKLRRLLVRIEYMCTGIAYINVFGKIVYFQFLYILIG